MVLINYFNFGISDAETERYFILDKIEENWSVFYKMINEENIAEQIEIRNLGQSKNLCAVDISINPKYRDKLISIMNKMMNKLRNDIEYINGCIIVKSIRDVIYK